METEDNIPLIKYFQLLFTNKIIFINVIGNLILYIPIVFYLNANKYYLLIVFTSIILLELLQKILSVGVFDWKDIVLNTIGLSIGYIAQRGEKNGWKEK